MSLSTTTVTVSEDRTSVSEIAIGEVKLDIVPELSTVSVEFVLPETDSSKYIFTPYRDIGSTNIENALNEFANEVGVTKQNECQLQKVAMQVQHFNRFIQLIILQLQSNAKNTVH